MHSGWQWGCRCMASSLHGHHAYSRIHFFHGQERVHQGAMLLSTLPRPITRSQGYDVADMTQGHAFSMMRTTLRKNVSLGKNGKLEIKHERQIAESKASGLKSHHAEWMHDDSRRIADPCLNAEWTLASLHFMEVLRLLPLHLAMFEQTSKLPS